MIAEKRIKNARIDPRVDVAQRQCIILYLAKKKEIVTVKQGWQYKKKNTMNALACRTLAVL